MKRTSSSVADLFSNADYNRFDPAKPFRYYPTADEQGGGGGVTNSGDDDGEDENPNPTKPAQSGGGVDLAVNAAVIDLVAEHGSENAALKFLVKRNHSLEKINKNVLPKADRDLYAVAKATGLPAASLKAMADACTEFNIKPTELKAFIENGSKAVKAQTEGEKKGNLELAANAGGERKVNAAALMALPGALDHAYSVEGEGEAQKGFITVTVDGKPIKTAIDKWVADNYPAFKKSLFDVSDDEADEDEELESDDDSEETDEVAENQSGQRQKAVAYVRSGGVGTGKTKGKSVFEQIREKNAEKAKAGTKLTTTQLAEKAGMLGR